MILYSLSTKARNNLNLYFNKDISMQWEKQGPKICFLRIWDVGCTLTLPIKYHIFKLRLLLKSP